MKKKFVYFILLLTQFSIACPNLDFYKKEATNENKFMVAFFYSSICDNCQEFNEWANQKPVFKDILNKFVSFNVTTEIWDINQKMFLDYSVPFNADIHALVLDVNGKEITRISSNNDIYAIFQELQFYAYPTNDLKDYLINYNKKKTIENAEELIENYYKFSQNINSSKKSNFISISNSYLNEAITIAKKKRKYNVKTQQKVELISLYELAFINDYDALKSKLDNFNEVAIHEENKSNFYFLKLVVEKAFNNADYETTMLKLKNSSKYNFESKLQLIKSLFS